MMTKTGGLNLFEDWAEILVMWTFSGAILILLMFLVPFLFLFRLELLQIVSSFFLLLFSLDDCALAVLTRAGELWEGFFIHSSLGGLSPGPSPLGSRFWNPGPLSPRYE